VQSSAAPSASSTTGITVPTPAPTPKPPATPIVTGGDVAAVVNGHKVPMSEFKTLLVATQREYASQPTVTLSQIENQVMNQVIGNEIVREYAAAHHISVPKSEVDARMKTSLKQAGSRSHFDQQLAGLGLTESSYRSLVAQNLLVEKVANNLFPVNTNQTTQEAHVRHILISQHPQGKNISRTDAQAKKLAESLKNKINHGASFAKLAKQYSDDPSSAVHGGDLGQIFPGQTVPPFNKAVFSLKLHHLAVVKSQYGYHVIEVLSRGKGKMPAGNQQAQQQQKFSTWAQAQEKKATIKKLARVKAGTTSSATKQKAG
jgi:parvulin-like peptidyl-prolyl isomerase